SPDGARYTNNTGLYTAPPSVSAQQAVTARATSAADSSRFATPPVTRNANGTRARPITIYKPACSLPVSSQTTPSPIPITRSSPAPTPAFPVPTPSSPGPGPWALNGCRTGPSQAG